jgi:hypothetical protein
VNKTWTQRHPVKLKLCYDQQSVGPSRVHDHIYITVRQMQVSWCGMPSLMRGCMCILQLLLGLTRAVILRIMTIFALSNLRLTQPEGPGSRIYLPQEHGGPVIPLGHSISIYILSVWISQKKQLIVLLLEAWLAAWQWLRYCHLLSGHCLTLAVYVTIFFFFCYFTLLLI